MRDTSSEMDTTEQLGKVCSIQCHLTKIQWMNFSARSPVERDGMLSLPLDAIESGHKIGPGLGVAAFVGSVKSIASTNTQINQPIDIQLFKIN